MIVFKIYSIYIMMIGLYHHVKASTWNSNPNHLFKGKNLCQLN